jgi:hypothetical protein
MQFSFKFCIFTTLKTLLMRRFSYVLLLGVFLAFNTSGTGQVTQGYRGFDTVQPVQTAVPFLTIAPDARSGGLGEAGVALSPDANSLHWNGAKMAFSEKQMGLAASYTPWLQELVNDIYLAHLSGFKKIDNLQAMGVSLTYFNLGQIQFTDANGQDMGEFNPKEFTINVGYSRKLSENLSGGLSLKYIYSNLAAGQEVNGVQIQPGHSVAADVSTYYTNDDLTLGSYPATLRLGAAISNIGSKISYTESQADFIPTNLGIGSSLSLDFDEYNELTFAFDINKLMVPTPDPRDTTDASEMSVARGMFTSFSDAPGGAKEEFHELMYSMGMEYWYADQFAVRAGYFNEHSSKGNRKFFTLGLGLKLNVFGLDAAYLIPTNFQQSPLDNTLRFTLSFDFDKLNQETEEDEKQQG